jgi:hypothetical protein
MELVLRDHRGRKGGRYWLCKRCWEKDRPQSRAICPWCKGVMKFSNSGTGRWKGVHIWWCERCRYPRRTKKQVETGGTPLGNRPVAPGSMHHKNPKVSQNTYPYTGGGRKKKKG